MFVSRGFFPPCRPYPVLSCTSVSFGRPGGSQAFLSSGRLLCLKGGLPEETVDSLLEAAQNEIKEAKIPVYLRMQCVYARRK